MITTACLIALYAAAQKPDSTITWLADLDVKNIEQSWEYAQPNRSVDKNPLRMAGQTYQHGVGTHSDAIARIRLTGAQTFIADVGIDDEANNAQTGAKRGSVHFVFVVDRKPVLTTPVLRGGDAPQHVEIDLRGAKELWLIVDGAGDGIDYDHADWANARIIGGKAELYAPEHKPGQILTPKTPAAPRINYPRVTGGSVGHPFLFRIPASGKGRLQFRATGLPAGLKLDRNTGIISGLAVKTGTSAVRVTVNAGTGVTSAGHLITINIHDKLALTPPMGWNSWNVWGCAVDAQKIRDAADEMISTGLYQHGWQYINIDDCWMRKPGPDARDPETHAILTNEKFPDMRGLADYVHAKGLKLGIYIGPNEHTCQEYEASIGHEKEDLEQFAKWGIDYVKYDWCASRRDSVEIKYRKYGALIKQLPRDIVYSLCEYGMDSVWTWGASAGGNLWRTTGDISDTWASMSGIGFRQDRMAPYAGPGHWNDPDMLVVGMLGWGPKPRPTRLTPDEQYTHISLWSMLAAPLLIGADMTKLDPFTLNLLTNDEVIAIDQDALGKQAIQVLQLGDGVVYKRPLADGSWAVAVFNRGYDDREMAFAWKAIGISGVSRVRDLWRQKDVPMAAGFRSPVASHGVRLLRVYTRSSAR